MKNNSSGKNTVSLNIARMEKGFKTGSKSASYRPKSSNSKSVANNSNHSTSDFSKASSKDHKSKSKSKKPSINPVWNVQLGINQVAELYAIQNAKHLSSRTGALQMLLDKGRNLVIKNSEDKAKFNLFKKGFLIKHMKKAIRQYRKYHEK